MSNTTVNAIEKFIVNWLELNSEYEAKNILLDENVFQVGYLDSLSMFRLLFDIETEFSLEIIQETFFQTNPCSIKDIAKAILTNSDKVH